MARLRRKGFQPAGSLPAESLELPRKRARELGLIQSWERAAGEAIARRTRVNGVRRGVLEIELLGDPAWAGTLDELLPRLAGRFAAARPELGVLKYRLRVSAENRAEPTRAIETVTDAPPAAPASGRRPVESSQRPEDSRWSERLPELMRRYLERSDGQK